mmetsp:Transcript_65857/g.157395  ORF Transcript_65857/g.157395 Transcript_65857/m.157395 type:complete len:801 (-) Transcript_65857:64-2466(-)
MAQCISLGDARLLDAENPGKPICDVPYSSLHVDWSTVGEYRQDITGLRCLAVVAVVLYHLDEHWCPSGFTGVDIFFVISGFAVMTSMSKPHSLAEQGKSRSWSMCIGFLVRRIRRLAPSLLLVVLAGALGMSFLCPGYIGNRLFYDQGIYGTIGVSNVHLVYRRVSYWQEDEEKYRVTHWNLFLHLWSLGVEEQFYLVFPWLLLVSSEKLWAFCWLASLLICGCWASGLASGNATMSFFLLPSRFWELASGVLVCQLKDHPSCGPYLAAFARSHTFWLEVGAIIMLALSLTITPTSGFPFPWAMILPVPATILFIIAGLSPTSKLKAAFSHWLPVYIGDISYVAYLWHMPVMINSMYMMDERAEPMQWKLFVLVTVAVLAVLTHHFVEQPLRQKSGESPPHHLKVIGTWAIAAALVIGVVHGLEHRVNLYDVSFGVPLAENAHLPAFVLLDDGAAAPATSMTASAGDGSVRGICSCLAHSDVAWHPPGAIHSSGALASSAAPSRSQAKCFEDRPAHWKYMHIGAASGRTTLEWSHIPVASHRVEKPGERPALIVHGDSHMEVLAPAIRTATHMPIYRVDSIPYNNPSKDPSRFYLHLRSALQPGDALLLTFWRMRFDLQIDMRHAIKNEASLSDWLGFMGEVINITRSRNATLLFLEDVPTLTSIGTLCLPTVFRGPFANCTVSLTGQGAEDYPTYYQVMEFLRMEGVPVHRQQHLMCGDAMCTEKVPGTQTLAYDDRHHVSHAGASYLAPFLCSFLADLGFSGVPGMDTAPIEPFHQSQKKHHRPMAAGFVAARPSAGR